MRIARVLITHSDSQYRIRGSDCSKFPISQTFNTSAT